ncbi:hypothetical protein TNCV_2865961 [Trichonephila clavipes]|nr:hypothetical protein TNCV_2865961 [Trichonephila clavipes]
MDKILSSKDSTSPSEILETDILALNLSRLEIELAIPFVPNRDPPDTPQQSELGEVVHYSIRMKSLPIAAAYGRTYGSRISSRYLRPVTVPPWNTCRSVWPPSEIPAQTRIPPPL